jgi:hypothetical protein
MDWPGATNSSAALRGNEETHDAEALGGDPISTDPRRRLIRTLLQGVSGLYTSQINTSHPSQLSAAFAQARRTKSPLMVRGHAELRMLHCPVGWVRVRPAALTEPRLD